MKKIFFLVVILAMCLSLCACASTAEQIKSSPTIEVTEPATEPPQETMSKAEMLDLYFAAVEDALHHDVVIVEGDETRIRVTISYNGFEHLVTTITKAGFDQSYLGWVQLTNGWLIEYDYICELALTYGLDDTTIVLCGVNENNIYENYLVIENGVVIYDVMAE